VKISRFFAVMAAVCVPIFPSTPAFTFEYHFETLTVADGLVQSQIMDLHQDRNGSLWIATSGGVSRYDGRFINYTSVDGLGSDQVYAIAEDSDGILWFATLGGGLSSFDELHF